MPFFSRKKLTPAERAEQIKEKHAKKMAGQGMFTPAQEKLREELGLKPGVKNKKKPGKKTSQDGAEKKVKKIKDPLSARQRKLMEELGLVKKDDKRFE